MLVLTAGSAWAEVKPHNIFGDNMVLQRGKPVKVWGTADRGETVTVEFAGQKVTAKADRKGNWSAELEPMKASAEGRTLVISSQVSGLRSQVSNVVVGDIWFCGGQSNMEDPLAAIYHGDVEIVSANHPNIRLVTLPQVASTKALEDIDREEPEEEDTPPDYMKGNWAVCSPSMVREFSAIGYIFGRRLHLASGVPIGLVDASWGGTTIEAWTSRATLATISESKGLTSEWDRRIKEYSPAASLRHLVEEWKVDCAVAREHGHEPPPKPTEPELDPVEDRNNPGGSFNGIIAPLSGFKIKGFIFNQGFNNALGNARPKLYAKAFKAMIQDWRRAFDDKSLPFGIVGLTAGGRAQTLENFEMRMLDPGPFIREGQLKVAQELENVCFMPAYDQQVQWFHPHTKLQLAERIARWALNTQYGFKKIGWKPVVCTAFESKGDHMLLTLSADVAVNDGRPIEGFAIAGKDRRFFPAKAEHAPVKEYGDDEDDIERHGHILKVWSPLVKKPVAARYAWARNPLGNISNAADAEAVLPVPSFRTDGWDWPEAPFEADGDAAMEKYHDSMNAMRENAEAARRKRIGR